MKVVLAIVVYDRIDNLIHWLECLEKCYTPYVEIAIIHNVDNDSQKFYYLYGRNETITFIPCANIGYDIGRFQDICRNRLPGFPEYDRLLWVTDDVFPMSKDFIKQFNNAMQPSIGVAAMQISNSVKKHIRTSAFMIDRNVAERLTFPADPITTKRQCYEFEHLTKNAFYEQVINMGLKVVQVAPDTKSPLWDSGFIGSLRRHSEHAKIFGTIPVQPPYVGKKMYL